MEKNIKAVKLTTIITCIIMFVCLIILTLQFIKIANLRDKSNNLATYKSEMIEQINAYDTTNDYYNNNRSEYLESYAREVLGWGMAGETWYTSN